jgi:acyl-CoA dehydrogenase
MATTGVSTSPIPLISGASPFCQTFFDDVVVPKDNLVGERGNGWTIAKYLLTHEREMIGAMGFDSGTRKSLSEVAKEVFADEAPGIPDQSLRADIARHEIDAWAFALTMERIEDEAKAGQGVGAASSMLKYYGTELNKQRNELNMAIRGSDALEWESERSGVGGKARAWLRSRANSIEGGTSEVQLNIIAKHILQLPSA